MKVNQPNNYRVECSTLFFYSCFGTGSPDKLLFTKIAIICIRRQTHALFANNWGGRHLISNSLEILSKSDYSLEYISALHPPPFQKKVILQQSPWYSTTSFCGVKVSILHSKLFTKRIGWFSSSQSVFLSTSVWIVRQQCIKWHQKISSSKGLWSIRVWIVGQGCF